MTFIAIVVGERAQRGVTNALEGREWLKHYCSFLVLFTFLQYAKVQHYCCQDFTLLLPGFYTTAARFTQQEGQQVAPGQKGRKCNGGWIVQGNRVLFGLKISDS